MSTFCGAVGPSKVVFADEISTGLDSSTTYHIVQNLSHYAHKRKVCVHRCGSAAAVHLSKWREALVNAALRRLHRPMATSAAPPSDNTSATQAGRVL